MTQEQRQIILEIDAIAKTKTLETFEDRWLKYIEENQGPNRKSLSDFSLSDERNKDVIVIVGPGPSILQYQERIRELSDVATICVLPTALEWSLSQGLYPDFVVIQDSGYDGISIPGDCPFIGPTTLQPGLVQAKDMYLFTLLLGGGIFNSWDEYSLRVDSDLDGGITSMGCVTNMAIEVVTLLRGSGQLRASKIVLIGQDFGGWRGLARVPRFGATEPPKIGDKGVTDEWLEWNGFQTDPRMIWYKYKLLLLWARTNAPLWSTSHGMLYEIPFVFFERLLRGKFPSGYPGHKEIVRRFEQYAGLMADTFPREEEDG